jgi:biotin transport system substrate-specific component
MRSAGARVLIEALWPSLERPSSTRAAILALVGSLLLILSAKAQVPFWPVPMTMQTLAVVVIGMTYGMRLGLGTVMLYLGEGLAGLPVFAGPVAGPAYFLGPTAGYLVGFLLAVGVVGYLAERGWDRGLFRVALAMILGHVLLFVPGVAWLSVLMGTQKAVTVGLLPFIPVTILKTALGTALMPAAWSIAGRFAPRD